MARLGDLWADFRAGKPIRSKSAKVSYVQFSKDDPYWGDDCLYDEFGQYETFFGVEMHWMDADDWELAPERVADYDVGNGKIETHVVGKQPGNFGAIEGSFRDAPARVADYLVQISGSCWLNFFPNTNVPSSDLYHRQTHPIGQQPEGSVLVPGSERNQE